jgi:hypothetical protein
MIRQRELSRHFRSVYLRARAGWERSVSGRVSRCLDGNDENLDSFGDRGPLLRWLVFTGLCVFAFVLL